LIGLSAGTVWCIACSVARLLILAAMLPAQEPCCLTGSPQIVQRGPRHRPPHLVLGLVTLDHLAVRTEPYLKGS
jgi:hypothetical protein